MCVCFFFPFDLDIKFVGRTDQSHTGGRSHRISHPPPFCGACLNFSRMKDSVIPFPRRPWSRILCTNDLIVLHLVGHFYFYFSFFHFLVRKIPFVVVVSHIQRIRCQPEKSTLHGGQSRLWSAEQGEENKRKSLAAYPPPHTHTHTARSEKNKKKYKYKSRDASTGATQVSVGLASVQGYIRLVD